MYMVECFSYVRNDEVFDFATVCMELEEIMLSKISMEKDEYWTK